MGDTLASPCSVDRWLPHYGLPRYEKLLACLAEHNMSGQGGPGKGADSGLARQAQGTPPLSTVVAGPAARDGDAFVFAVTSRNGSKTPAATPRERQPPLLDSTPPVGMSHSCAHDACASPMQVQAR